MVGTDLSQQHPLLAFKTRANFRHHAAHLYNVTTGPVREDKQAVASVRVKKGGEVAGVESLRDKLKAESDLIVIIGDGVQGDALRKLVAFGDSLGIPVKYICTVDYSNSRGAFDMGLIPRDGGMSLDQMLASPDLDVLWVVGANPLKGGSARGKERIRRRPGPLHDRNRPASRPGSTRCLCLRKIRHRDQRHRRSPETEASRQSDGREDRSRNHGPRSPRK